MIAIDSLLLQAKADIHHRLLGDEALASVPVLRADDHDAEARDQLALGPRNWRAGKTGACVVVSAIGVLGLDTANTPSPLMAVGVEIECLEDVLLNAGDDGTGIDAAGLVARVVQSLHLSHYDDRFTGLALAKRAPVAELYPDEPGVRGFAVRFEAGGMAFATVATCAPVTCAVDGGLAALSCATEGADIHYTLDGGYPGPGNPDALAYSAPFAASPGDRIRAAASKTGLNPSKLVSVYVVSAA